MFNFRKPQKPAEAQAPSRQASPSSEEGVPLPNELRDALKAALGHDIPEAITKKQAEVLAREVATKAPSLQRDLIDWMVGEYTKKVRNKPSPKTARPPGIWGWFYVKDSDGNWVPSRMRIFGSLFAAVGAFVLLLMAFFIQRPADSATPPSQETPPTVVAEPIPQPPSQPTQPTQEATAEGSTTPSSTQGQEQQAPPGLPPPPADLPPPPDYEPTAQTAESLPGGVVVYQRPGQAAQPSPENPNLVNSLGRSVDPAGFAGRSGAAPAGQGGQGQEAASSPSAPFWSRGGQPEQASEPFWKREVSESKAQTESFWSRGKPSSQEEGQLIVPKDGEQGGEGQTEIVYRRSPEASQGGIIPPAAAPSVAPSGDQSAKQGP